MSGYVFAVVLSLVTLAFIVQLLRTRRLREKYAGLWLVVLVVIIVLALFPGIAFRLAAAVGVETPSNLLFAASVLVLLLVAIQLSTEVSRLEEETRTIAERTAILAHRIERLENAGPGSDSAADGHAGEPAGETTATDARETGPDRRDG